MVVARSELAAAEGQVVQAQGAYQQALDELETKQELNRRGADIVARREIEASRGRGCDPTRAPWTRPSPQRKESKRASRRLLPAQKASAKPALAEAEVELSKTVVRAGVTGQCRTIRAAGRRHRQSDPAPGRRAHSKGAGRGRLQAGFGQIEGQVMKVGMLAEVTCISKPWTVIPMVVTDVQDLHRGRTIPRR